MRGIELNNQGSISLNDSNSIWWNRGLAIFIALLAVFSGFSAVIGAIFDFGTILNFIEASTEEIEEPIHPGDNATEEELKLYEEEKMVFEEINMTLTMMRQMEEKNIQDKQILFYGLTFLIALPVVALVWTKHEYWLQSAIGWASFQFAGSIWLQAITIPILAEMYSGVPGGNYMQYSGFASTSGCSLLIFGFIALVYLSTNEKANSIPDSAFHLNSVQNY